jgi:hypothetical protein
MDLHSAITAVIATYKQVKDYLRDNAILAASACLTATSLKMIHELSPTLQFLGLIVGLLIGLFTLILKGHEIWKTIIKGEVKPVQKKKIKTTE